MQASTLISLAGSLMTLFGLLVSLFAVHLGNWLSKLQALQTKWSINNGSDPSELAARRECRYEFVELYNWQPFLMTFIIVCFGAAVVYFFNDVRASSGTVFPGIFTYVYNSFFVVALLLQLALLLSGWRVGTDLKSKIAAAFPKPKANVSSIK